MKLYELTQAYQAILDLDIDQDSLDLALQSLDDTLQEKAENIGRLIAQLEAENVAYKNEIDRLLAKKKANDQKQMKIEEYLDFNLKAMGITKLETALFKFSYRKSESVVIDDLELIPEAYKRVKTTVDADKTTIKSALKNGLLVGGAHIEEKQNLQIK